MNAEIKSAILKYIVIHKQIQYGCKSSCGTVEFGSIVHPVYTHEKEKFFIRFGGYCLDGCDRWHELIGNSPKEAIDAFNEILDKQDLSCGLENE